MDELPMAYMKKPQGDHDVDDDKMMDKQCKIWYQIDENPDNPVNWGWCWSSPATTRNFI